MTSPRTSPRSTPARRRKTPAPRRPWLGWLFKLGLVGAVLLAALMVYLDAIVQEKFSGKVWTVPAKVYARPLELFAGMRLDRQEFLTELDALGYRRENAASSPGAVSVATGAIELHTRGFQFYEGSEPARRLRVSFSASQVASLTRADGSPLAVARLEPLLMGGLYPAHQEDRILIKLEQAPPLLVDTLVAVEDRDFFSHFGVSPKAILRAMWVNLTAGQVVQGGSTDRKSVV